MVGDQVKAIAKRYDQVEEQPPRSVRYAKRDETDNGTVMMTQAWFNGAGDLLKVATDRTSPEGRELTKFTPADPYLDRDGLFVFTRKETPVG